MYVGRTNLSIDDIRAWNSLHKREYELHINDCRHFVNSLVKYTTGAGGGPRGRERAGVWGLELRWNRCGCFMQGRGTHARHSA